MLPCCHTVNQDPTEGSEWMKLRGQCGVYTASGIPSILGCGYDSRAEMWRVACGQPRKPFCRVVQENMARGRALEPQAAEWLTQWWSPIGPGNFWTRPLVLPHIGAQITIGASPDGMYPVQEGFVVVEIKNPTSCTDYDYHQDNKWWNWYVQVQCQLFCTAQQEAILCIWHPQLEPVVWSIRWHPEFWEQFVVPRLEIFHRYVLGRTEPPRLIGVYAELLEHWAARLDSLNRRKDSAKSLPPGKRPCREGRTVRAADPDDVDSD